MESRQSHGATPSLEGACERTDHSPSASRTRHCERDLGVIQATDQARWNLQRSATATGFTNGAPNNGPAADKIESGLIRFYGLKTSLRTDEELIFALEFLLELSGLCTRMRQSRFIGEIETTVLHFRRLWNDGNRNRRRKAFCKVAQEAVTDTEQAVRGGAANGNLDAVLEAAPERPMIVRHDRESAESENQDYSPPAAL